MSTLREKFEAARRQLLPLGTHSVTIRRPTDWEICALQRPGSVADIAWASSFVVDWSLQESDLLPGGDPVPAPYDAYVFVEWIKDHPDLWSPLVDGVIRAYRQHRAAEDDRGNA